MPGEAGATECEDSAPRGDEEPAASSIPLFARRRTIRELATEALTHSKDLEIAARLTEALVRSDGLIGLAAGSRLMAGVAENFWDELFPQPDEDGIATRVNPLAGLHSVGRDGTLLEPLRKVVLSERPRDKSRFDLYQYERSLELAGLEMRNDGSSGSIAVSCRSMSSTTRRALWTALSLVLSAIEQLKPSTRGRRSARSSMLAPAPTPRQPGKSASCSKKFAV
jgi:type VI secretion system protein ImpA